MRIRISETVLTLFIMVVFVLGQTTTTANSDSLTKKIEALQNRIEKLEQKNEQSELERLLNQAETAAKEDNIKEDAQKTFKSGQRSLQAINPEISVTGDMFSQAVANKNGFNRESRSGAYFRVLGLHFQSALDPFSFTKIAVEIHPEGIELGEAYMTWSNVLPNLSLTAGKFRQQFGIINRWHAHSLDQFDFPLAMTTLLGEDGLNQTGLSLDWFISPLWADANTLTLQITNGQNGHLFSGEAFRFPALLGHLKSYYDLNANTYFELGLSGMSGFNNFRGFDDSGSLQKDPNRYTRLAGVDLTLFWEPLNRAHYHSFLWRSELYYVNKEASAADSSIKAVGGYSYVDYKLNERWNAGIRFDYTQPFTMNNSDANIYQLVPYVTWWQSHWMRFRLQYNYKNGSALSEADHIIRLQLTWAAGPHKHERY